MSELNTQNVNYKSKQKCLFVAIFKDILTILGFDVLKVAVRAIQTDGRKDPNFKKALKMILFRHFLYLRLFCYY